MKKFLALLIVSMFLCWHYSQAQVGIGTTSPLSTLDVRGSASFNVAAKTTSYTLSTNDNTVVFNGSANATFTLPSATACTGREYWIKNSSTYTLTIATSLSQSIDGNSTWVMSNQYEAVMLMSDGANWIVKQQAVPTQGAGWVPGGNSVSSTKNLGTTSNIDLPIITNNTERVRVLNSGNMGIGTTTPSEKLEVNGNIKATNIRTYGLTRTVPTTLNDAVDIGSFALTNGGAFFDISIVVPASGFSVSKYYSLPIKYSQTGGAWNIATPTTSSGSYGGNDFDMDLNVNGGTCSLRVRRSLGNTTGTAYITIKHQGVVSDVFTASTTVNSVAAPLTSYSGLASSSTTVSNSLSGTNLTTTVNGVAATALDIAPAINSTAWSKTGNSGSTAGTNFIGTTDAVDFVTKTNAAERMRITSAGNVGIGTSSPAEALDVNGNIRATNIRTYGVTRGMPTTINDAVDIGSFNFSNGGGFIDVSIVVPSSGFSVSKYYALPIKYSQTSGSWVIVTPTSNSGSYGGNDFDMDYNVNGGTCSLRIRRSAGGTPGTAYVTIKHQGVVTDAFTASTTVTSVSTPSTSSNPVTNNNWSQTGTSGTNASTNFIGTTDAVDFVTKTNNTEVMRATSGGKVGIGVTSPAEVLDVNGNLKTSYMRTNGFTRTVPTVVNDAVDIGSFNFTNGGGYVDISIVVPSSGFSVSKYYSLPIKYSQTSNTWVTVTPTQNTGSYGGNDFDMDYNVNGGTCSFRIRRTVGSTAGIAYVSIRQQGVINDAFTASTTVNSVTAPTTTSNPAAANTNWSQTGNAGLTAGTNFIGTTDAVDVVTKSNNTEVMRATSSGKVGIGVTSPAEVLDVNGNIRATNLRTIGVTRTVPTTVNDAVDIGSFGFSNGGGVLDVSIIIPSGGFSVSKKYLLAVKYSQTGGAWVIASPTSNSDSYGGNDVDLDVNVNGGTTNLRLRRSAGTTAGTAYITIIQTGINTDAFTSSTTVNSVTAPTSYFGSSVINQSSGNVGVATSSPLSTFDVTGSQGASITTTSTNISLNATHSTVILTSGTPVVTLPSGSSCTRRIYTIVNNTGSNCTISSYVPFGGSTSTSLANATSYTLQSDGINWYRVK